MSDIDVRIDYAMVEEMGRLFSEASKQIEETTSEMLKIASSMESGALMGDTGEAFTQAIRSDLNNSLNRMKEKLDELVGDINGVIAAYRDGDQNAASRFK